MDKIKRINVKAQKWLGVISFEKWVISHDEGQRYGIVTINMLVKVLKGACSLLVTALI